MTNAFPCHLGGDTPRSSADIEKLINQAMDEVEKERRIQPEYKEMAKDTLKEFIESHSDSVSELNLTTLINCWVK